MSNRSAKWLKKKQLLENKERELIDDLNKVSDSLETGVKNVVIGAAVVGATVITGYIVYKAFFKKSKEEQLVSSLVDVPRKKAKKVKKKGKDLKSILVERALLTLLPIVTKKVSSYFKH